MARRCHAVAAALFLSVALLPGCATQPPASPLLRPARASIDAFSLDGRIAVQQGERRNASNISWRHSAARDEMLFTTPLGQGLAELTRDAAGAHLQLADRRAFDAADWEGLATQLFGFPLPLSALPRWLVGDLPAAAQDVVRDARGRPQRLAIAGWHIHYRDYESERADALPTLIELQRDDIEVKLKIDDWQLGAPEQTP